MLFQIYKPGQGRHVRIASGVLLALITLYGCAALRTTLSDAGPLPNWLLPVFMGQPVRWDQVLPVIVFVVVGLFLVWLLNYPKFAEFLIDTEIEMGRVAWPSRSNVVGSSMVVIVTVIIMSVLLFAIDRLLIYLMEAGKLY